MRRGRIMGSAALIAALATCTTQAQLTRADAVTAVLTEVGAGPDTAIWSPFTDFGSGPGFEGLLPAGAVVDQAYPDEGIGATTVGGSYFFWIDDDFGAAFGHDCGYVFVDSTNPAPTIDNGGITIELGQWWPTLDVGAGPVELFTDDFSPSAPGPGNSEGLIFGPPELSFPPPPAPIQDIADEVNSKLSATNQTQTGSEGTAPRACGIIVRGGNDEGRDKFMDDDVSRYIDDLIHLGVDPLFDLEVVNDGMQSTQEQFCNVLDNLPDDCDKLYIRWTGHGLKSGGLAMGNGDVLTPAEFCNKMAAIDIPTCVVINACYSEKMTDGAVGTDPQWSLPVGSSIITSSKSDEVSFGWKKYTDPDGNGTGMPGDFSGSIFIYAMNQCRFEFNELLDRFEADDNNDGVVDDCEAYNWVRFVKPCYQIAPNANRYPGGEAPDGAGDGKISTPTKLVFLDPDDPCIRADVDGDGFVTPADFTRWLALFNNPGDPDYLRADVNGDGAVDPADFTAWLAAFNNCN